MGWDDDDSRSPSSARRPYQTAAGPGLHGLKVPFENEHGLPLLHGQMDHGTTANGCSVEVVFRDIKERLVEYITQQVKRFDVGNISIVGCMAWLTDANFINFLIENEVAASIIINKKRTYHNSHLLNRISPFWLESKVTRNLWSTVFDSRPRNTCEKWQAVTCCGYMPPLDTTDSDEKERLKKRRTPNLMHNKFLVFIRSKYQPYSEPFEEGFHESYAYEPFAVWSGSINLTDASSGHFENSLIITNELIANAYWAEWGKIALLSEPLSSQEEQPQPSRVVTF